jgi:N-sulfoglucosamine sulfohydrolase
MAFSVQLRSILLVLSFGFVLARGLDAALPHIVIYLSDDHSQFDSSLYGAADIPMPHLEQLAADGMTFSHAFVASPSCAPSRAAMLTGLMPARNGARGNHTLPPEGTHYLIQDLRAAGYEVAAFGKIAHYGKTAAELAGFDVADLAQNYAPLKRNVTQYLQQRTADKPLCLFVGISNPHVPWPAESSFDPDALVLPPSHLDTPETRRQRAAYCEEIRELDVWLGELRALAAEHLGEEVLFVHTSDHGSQWPFGKWTLYDYGTRVPLVVAWPGVIEPGSQTAAMVSWIDLLPTLLEAAGGTAPEGIDGRSFAAVLRGEADEHRDRIFTTHSRDVRMNVYPSRSVRTREWKLIHNLRPQFAFTSHLDLLRRPESCAYWTEWVQLADENDPRAKAVVDRYYRRPEFELYHVAEDKWEMTNLAGDPQHADHLERLQQELADWRKSQEDTVVLDEDPRLLSDPAEWAPEYFGTREPK